MPDSPLHIAFLWHMHQPCYKDPFTGLYRLPWVRLHGVKDYLDMVRVGAEFPGLRQTFNVVPSLFEQLKDYLDNGAADRHLELTRRPAADLTEAERRFVIENFFLANWETMIKPFPRYYELLAMRGFRAAPGDLERASRYFTERDLRDLQVLFNLSWIDPLFRNADSALSGLVNKGRDFTEEEKLLVIDKQFEILRQIVPEYRRMSEEGRIELSVTPFYHPILPLLCDTDIARVAMPQVRLPRQRFVHPEDAREQIRRAVSFFEATFGHRPAGMWPSEGSVSEEVLGIMAAEGLSWTASDEEVLAGSLGRSLRGHEGELLDAAALYRPHRFKDVAMFFRDHKLSDLIGFTYSGWHADRAAEDFVRRLGHLRDALPRGRAFIVPIILDGENAWEYYPNDGQDFLRALYRAVTSDPRFRTVTFSGFLQEYGSGDGGETLSRLHAGSWIYGNFGVWIGHEEDNRAWDYLSQTRSDFEAFRKAHPEADLAEAWEALYAAEGSDWNWWYGDDHSTETAEEFDELFRGYLKKVYAVMGMEPPQQLGTPVLRRDRTVAPTTSIRGFIHPRIDGLVSNYFEWQQAASLEVKRSGGSMHRAESFITMLYYGFNKDNFYLRLDPAAPFTDAAGPLAVSLNIEAPALCRIVFPLTGQEKKALLERTTGTGWSPVKTLTGAAVRDIVELEVPFADLAAAVGDELRFSVEIRRNGEEVERSPWRGHLSVTVPSPDFETMMWY